MGKGEGELKAWVQSKITKAADYIDTAADYVTNEEKDACYHKVKSRYKVWPSAYASGALVKCRKKGAKNWGNKKFESNFSKLLEEWEKFLESGLLVRKGNRFFLSEPNGMELSNQVLVSMFKWWDEIN